MWEFLNKYMELILSLLLLAAALEVLIWGVVKIAALMQKNRDKRGWAVGCIRLVILIKHSEINKESALLIMEEFNKIEFNPEKNPERVIKLRKEFEERFADIIGGL